VRITGLRATPVAVPFHLDEVWAYGTRRGLACVLLELTTDEGVSGLGEAAAYPSAEVVQAVLRTVEPLVVGEDPFRVERIVKLIDVVGTWHHVRATSPAIAAVEMACWDVIGKTCGQPLHNLLGGRVRDAVPYIWYVSGATPEAIAAHARQGAAAGFESFYLKVGASDPGVDVERVAALRDGAGPAARLRVDANEAWSAAFAIRVLGELERFGLEFAEQPVSGRNLEQMAYVRGRVGVPLLANEASWTRYDQLEVIRHGAADAVSVDNQMDAGLLNLKRSAGLCEAAALGVVKHSLGELGVATAAAAQVIAATPNFLYASQSYASLLADDVVTGGPLRYQAGSLPVPTGPGLGVELDPDRVARAAERFTKEGAAFAFGDPAALTTTPLLPKR
jgi:L-alanine-DL-glutamate epimerase-like enolase superfamily enzyme